jgi:hypothetical protein
MMEAELKAHIAELKAHIAKLENRVAALEPAPPPPPPRQEEGVRIFYPPDQTGFIEPSAEQLRRLLTIVYAKWPTLGRRLDDNSPRTFDSIQQTMFALGVMKRTAEVDYSKSAGIWISYVEKILSEHHRSAPHIHTAVLCAAALCHNDIAIGFQWPDNGFHDFIGLGFALSPHVGTSTTNGWRALLDGSEPLRSLVRPTPNIEPKNPVRVYGY